MMALLQVLVILQLLLAPALLAYPAIYGTKRYAGSLINPAEYYDLYPYYKQQMYPDAAADNLYYPQEYPVYYPPARTSKYEVYQAVLPYYYQDDIQDPQSIGHETYYQSDDDLDDVNAAFLHNLIMSQMNDVDVYGKWEDTTTDSKLKTNQKEDKDVRELKQLVKPKPSVHWFENSEFRNQKKSQTERKPVIKAAQAPSVPNRDTRGQKEVVLMRPATPVRNPFPQPVLDMMNSKRSPSVYDTIKHLLNAEKNDLRTIKKRLVSSEESLARQLSVLKKAK